TKQINAGKAGKASLTQSDLDLLKTTLNTFVFDVLGLKKEAETDTKNTGKLSKTVELLIELRKQARENKNFALSDQIRDELAELGIELKDGREGTSFSL